MKNMGVFEKRDEAEIRRINREQQKVFDRLYRLFDPPLPEGVPERLEQIVAAGRIAAGETVLDVGTGTGILIPLIAKYKPARIYACDLSEAMLEQLRKNHPRVTAFLSDVRDLTLPDACLDVVFINACYPNIVDKQGAFTNIARMVGPGGRLVISHPLGRAFIEGLKKSVSFPLDDFPDRAGAEKILAAFDFSVLDFIDEAELYILTGRRQAAGESPGRDRRKPLRPEK